ncbi:MAG: ATP-binding protein [Acidimicrobiales bacterium]
MTLPPLVASSRGYPFHGRAEQLAALESSWARVERGPSRLVLVAGEPGVGKTRLTVEFARRRHDDGIVVLAGSCAPDPIGSYQPIREAMRHYVAAVGAANVAAAMPERVPLLTRLVPELGLPGPPPTGDPELQRLALFDAICAVLADAGGDRPALLIVDDLHWADPSTIVLVRHLLRSLPQHRLLLAATLRPHEIAIDHPLADAVAALRSAELVDRIDLGGLDRAGVRTILESRAGHELDADLAALADDLYRITEGNPFFVIQLVRHLFDTGRLVVDHGRWLRADDERPLDLPVEVREVVGRRLANLTTDCRALLRCAAVLGLEFDLEPLSEVSGHDSGQSLGLLEQAMGWRVVDEVPGTVDRFHFVHAMFRQGLYDGMSITRRQLLHQRAAAAYRAAGPGVYAAGDVANHLLAAAAAVAPGDVVAAVLDAGREAMDRTDYESAASLCTRALDVVGRRLGDAHRLTLLALRAEAKLFTGEVTEARDDVVTSATLAETVGDIGTMADVLTAWCRTAPMLGPAHDVLGLCDRALAELPEGEERRRARLMGALCHQLVLTEPLPSIERRALEAYRLAREIDDQEAIGHAATAYRLVADYRPLAERRHDVLDAITEVAPTGGARTGRLLLGQHALIHALELGDRRAFDAALADYGALSDELQYPLGRATALRARATIAVGEGRLAEAEAMGAEAFELTPYAIVSYTSLLFALYRELDRLAEVAPAVPEFIAQFPDIVTWRVVALGIDHELGRTAAVTEGLRRLADDGFRSVDGAVAMRANVAVLSELAAASGDPTIAGTLFDRFVGWSGQNLAIEEYICLGASDRYLGQLETVIERYDDAVARLEAAIGFDEAFGSHLWAGYDRLALAQALARRSGPGDAERAGRLLDEVELVAAGTGSARLRRLVELER